MLQVIEVEVIFSVYCWLSNMEVLKDVITLEKLKYLKGVLTFSTWVSVFALSWKHVKHEALKLLKATLV